MSVALSSKFSIINILSETFAPPMMATKGFSLLCITLSALATSLFINKPNTLFSGVKYLAITAVLACARCAVPKASFTYTSPNLLSFSANASSPASSSL